MQLGLNDAVLRAFEQLSEVEAVRPDIAGNMGAFGAALLARERYQEAVAREARKAEAGDSWSSEFDAAEGSVEVVSSLLSLEQLAALSPTQKTVRCKASKSAVPNLYEYKSQRLFGYEPLAPEDAPRGSVGIPRALNQYENYPFWFTFFTKLGWRVVLSDPSTKKTYEAGIESMPSESVCYPAKLSHGHIMNLLDKRRGAAHAVAAVRPEGAPQEAPVRGAGGGAS